MTGFSNYSADNVGNFHFVGIPMPALTAAWLALFTAVGTDAGTGFTEISGNGYARVQVMGAVAATASFTTGSPNITMTANPGWVVPGMNVYDLTNGQQIGTVLTYSGTALVLTANAAHASSGSTDSLVFSLFPQFSGTAPSTSTNGGVATFPTPTGGGWATATIAWGIYDAATVGNLLEWDFLGSSAWAPFTNTSVGSGNGAVFTQHAHGLSNGSGVVVSTELGGTLSTVTQGQLISYLVNYAANVTTDTFTLSSSSTAPSSGNAVWTSTTGDGSARLVTPFTVGNATASFAASTLTLSLA